MPQFNVTKRRGKLRIKIADRRKGVMNKVLDSYSEDFDVKMSVIQEQIPFRLRAVGEELQQQFKRLTGKKYSRGIANAPWGQQNGSVYFQGSKIFGGGIADT